jgi:hypothetical protein
MIGGKPIKISEANRPNDVYWFNMKVSDGERNKNIFYSWAVLDMLLILSLAALVGIEFWQTSLQKASGVLISPAVSYLLSGVQSLLIFIINQILYFTMNLLSDIERHKTRSDRYTSLAIKTIVTQTINTCFLYAILYAIQPVNPLGTLGLYNKILSLVAISGVVNVLLCIFLPA